MKYNVIPRKFNTIIGKMLIDTSMNKVNDIVHISKDDCGYLSFNTRTQKYARCFVDMLRNVNIFELIEVK